MSKRVDGKVVIITGASSGMGEAAARLLAEEGATVVLAARRDKTQKVADEIIAAGGKAMFVRTDVLELADIENLVKTTIDTYGRIDVFYGNAGVGNFFSIQEMDLEKDFHYTINTFMRANWYAAKLILPHMMKQGKGDFIFTTSTAAYEGVPTGSVYSAGKAGLHCLVRAIAKGYGQYGIRANAVVPGLITTELSPAGGAMQERQIPQIPMLRAGEAKEVAYAVVFLASDECRFATGAELVIDGGRQLGTFAKDDNRTNADYNIGEGGRTVPID